jgi:hypothetical protein
MFLDVGLRMTNTEGQEKFLKLELLEHLKFLWEKGQSILKV